jgi:hypothetical protein
MDHWPRRVLFGSTALACWLGMQAVHELGHIVGAFLSGGMVERVVLHPFTISRTDLSHNPSPALVAWAGPICGVLLPLALWGGGVRLLSVECFFLPLLCGVLFVSEWFVYRCRQLWEGW